MGGQRVILVVTHILGIRLQPYQLPKYLHLMAMGDYFVGGRDKS